MSKAENDLLWRKEADLFDFFWKDSKFEERKVRNVRGSLPPLLREKLAEKIGADKKRKKESCKISH